MGRCGVFVVVGSGLEVADEAVAECPWGLVVEVASGPLLVLETPASCLSCGDRAEARLVDGAVETGPDIGNESPEDCARR